jgi:mannose-6-phosphate isomerase-like protein (cupin superfamily)/CDGSH-type Zn-finger protein
MSEPKIASRKGYCIQAEAGKVYHWCSCGLSATQPFCDGSHKGTEFLPLRFRASKTDDILFCGCKHTKDGPFCDGTHNNLPGGYRDDDPKSPENQAVRMVPAGKGPVVALDGECYVFSPAKARLTQRGNMAYCPVIGPAAGARYQSQFYAECAPGASPVISADGQHIVLFLFEGEGEVEISGRRFPLSARSGAYIRPSEAFRVENNGNQAMKLFISVLPGKDELTWLEDMPSAFEADYPDRMAEIDPEQRQKMAARHFQLLINKAHGSMVATQFIGNIPPSKAEPHRHLYEEALIFLAGAGVVWTEETKAAVGPGDVLFLPRKQVHSVQCTSKDGLDVVGIIFPGDNPSINY